MTYPGIYVEESSNGGRAIPGVPTSVAAFVGYTSRGDDHRPTRICSFADYERDFGGLAPESALGFAVRHFFDNGGRDAIVVRVPARCSAESPSEQGDRGSALGDGLLPGTADLIGSESDRTGIHALDAIEHFNLLCIPDAARAEACDASRLDRGIDPNSIYAAAIAYVRKRRAFLLIDPPPEVDTAAAAATWIAAGPALDGKNGAAYFPRLRLAGTSSGIPSRSFAPSGAVAGIVARIDASRGVWKAPAGAEASLAGALALVHEPDDSELAALASLGLNAFRKLPGGGSVVWSARTLEGAAATNSEWKYVPVRRTALHIEASISRGTQWVISEPNDERLWGAIRTSAGAFLHALFRAGAFAGTTPREGYFVNCDRETTTQDDVDQGIVNIDVGFAPLKPAEFVVIRIQQLARRC